MPQKFVFVFNKFIYGIIPSGNNNQHKLMVHFRFKYTINIIYLKKKIVNVAKTEIVLSHKNVKQLPKIKHKSKS